MTLDFFKKRLKNIAFFIYTSTILIICICLIVFNISSQGHELKSRKEFEKAIELVKKEKPTPPVTAIFYAKVSEEIYNKREITSEKMLQMLNLIQQEESLLPKFELKVGNNNNEFWIKQDLNNPKVPFSPKISQYDRFLLRDFTYQVPPPPVYKSAEFYQGLNQVKRASENRSSQQEALINFYGGVPGTEGPAGIWQNILWEEVNKENNKYFGLIFFKQISDNQYAWIQMLLAKSIADSFMECWKVKYVYQTKRPDMTDRSINVAMPNPPFPGYVSGHSTISFTAANILAHFIPKKKDIWLKHAAQARDSRLHAGIHFSYDNFEGQKLGEEVAKNIIFNLKKTQ